MLELCLFKITVLYHFLQKNKAYNTGQYEWWMVEGVLSFWILVFFCDIDVLNI